MILFPFFFLYLPFFIYLPIVFSVPSVKLNDLVLRGNGLKVRKIRLLRFQAERNAYRE